MFEPLRFLHVAEAGLDQPLGDGGPLPEPFQQLAEDATLDAFEHMIAGAISQKVDCVLLAGNTFREQDQSLRARRALLTGLQKLEEYNINVFVLPGSNDPESAWREIPNLPGNVTLLTTGEIGDEESPLPVAILREGRVIATITAGPLPQLSAKSAGELDSRFKSGRASKDGSVRSCPFRIGLVTAWPAEMSTDDELADRLSACRCEYLALPECRASRRLFEAGQTLNTRSGIAHHPGRLQARSARETGPHGATLIEVDNAGEIRGTFLCFAAARYLRFEMPIEPDAALEDIADLLSLQLLEEAGQTGERVWFVTWVLQGGGNFFRSLAASDFPALLIETLPKTAGAGDSILVHHHIKFQESPFPRGDDEALTHLERLYREALENISADESEIPESISSAVLSDIAGVEEARWREDLIPLARELDPSDVLAQARSLGRKWFHDVDED